MKTRMLSLIALIGLSSFALFANAPVTEKFKVAGIQLPQETFDPSNLREV